VSKNNNAQSVYNDNLTQPQSNQQYTWFVRTYVEGNTTRTQKATEARRRKLFNEWEKRLQRMGLGERAGDLAVRVGDSAGQVLDYGHEYLHDTQPFNYSQPTNNEHGRKVGLHKTYIGYCVDVQYMPEHEYAYKMVNGFDPDSFPEPRQYSTIDDNDWCDKQKAFPHTLSMPPLRRNFCPSCSTTITAVIPEAKTFFHGPRAYGLKKANVVVYRTRKVTRKGKYVLQNHECSNG